MISVTQLRQGVTFIEDGQPLKVTKYAHTHMGRGGGTIRVGVKNLRTGAALNKTFKSGEKVEDIDVAKRQMQFLYRDGTDLVMMDPQTYEQLQVAAQVLGDSQNYLVEGMTVWVHLWEKEETEVLDVDLPPKVVVTVKSAAPGDKGNTAANSYKEGELENGLRVKIPLFVNAGDQIRISTSDGSYIERV